MSKAIILDEEGEILVNKAKAKFSLQQPSTTITYNMTVKEALTKYLEDDKQ